MRLNKTFVAATGVAASIWTPAHAYEAGSSGWAQKPGITIGGTTADAPPPGLYMIDQMFTYQPNLTGPGNSVLNPHGTTTGVPSAVGSTAFVYAPGWSFLGASYDAALAGPGGHVRRRQPAECRSVGHDQSLHRACRAELEARGTADST